VIGTDIFVTDVFKKCCIHLCDKSCAVVVVQDLLSSSDLDVMSCDGDMHDAANDVDIVSTVDSSSADAASHHVESDHVKRTVTNKRRKQLLTERPASEFSEVSLFAIDYYPLV